MGWNHQLVLVSVMKKPMVMDTKGRMETSASEHCVFFFPCRIGWCQPAPKKETVPEMDMVVDLKMLTMRNCAKMYLFFKQSWKWKMAIYTCISIYIWKVTILFGDTIHVSNHDYGRKGFEVATFGLRGCHLSTSLLFILFQTRCQRCRVLGVFIRYLLWVWKKIHFFTPNKKVIGRVPKMDVIFGTGHF